MKPSNWLALSLLFFVFGCGQVGKEQVSASPVTPSTTTSASPKAEPATAKTESQAKAKAVRSGNFVSGEHPTQGTARIVMQDGQAFVELDDNFKTSSSGPDLVVLLHRDPDVIGSTKPPNYPLKPEGYAVLAPLQKYNGGQRYPIPTYLKASDYQSIVIWCRQFNAAFGAARLS